MMNTVLLQMSQTIAAPFCSLAILSLLVGLLWAIVAACRDGMLRLKLLHQIPCDRCLYFTGDHRLKCTVHPYKAFTEEAIDCRDCEWVSPDSMPTCAAVNTRGDRSGYGYWWSKKLR